ncbi:uncharacterized protein LOC124128721 [Haliotis rufescens]|uniref:uncharacterized protein LOC124128721 n=1 Tax=Haliotis rufescens TaxID=6454 RepID=UPI00201FABBE|nr:uncharacterized protein LOC124128721 [Haliotis rufescens]
MVDVLPAGALGLNPVFQNNLPYLYNGVPNSNISPAKHKDVNTASSDWGLSDDSTVDNGTSTTPPDSKGGSGDCATPFMKDNGHIHRVNADAQPPVALNPAPGVRDKTIPLEAVITCKTAPPDEEPLIDKSKLPQTRDVQDDLPSYNQVVGNDANNVYTVIVPLRQTEDDTSNDVSIPESQGEKSYKTTSLQDPFWKKVVAIFSILDVLLLITILVVGCAVKHDKPLSAPSDDNCLKCMDVYLTDDDRRDNIYKFDIKEGDLCCSKNHTLLIQKYVLKRYKHDHAKASAERYKNMPKRTAVHVDLDLQDNNSKAKGENQLLKWSGEDALINGHLTLTSPGTHIQFARAGLYYVNSKVVFADTKASAATKESVLLLQVYRRRGGQEMLLLENKSSQCGDADKVCNVPSSAQGVFQMEGGDQVFVRVTKPCGLVLQPRYNYLEAYLV